MNKRTKSIASLFANRSQDVELSADNSVRPPRVSSGSVRSMKDTFSQVERENEALRQSLVSGAQVQEIDPELIDPSPFADRFPDEDESSFESLVSSIKEVGQEVPVLLRRHPEQAGRFQTAYGHRRVRAARALSLSVRAVLRELDDNALAIAQGVENSAREDLTFIERAVFAARLEDRGAGRNIIQQALGVDKAEASKLLATARAVPEDVLRFVGRAPRIGRGRWQALAKALEGQGVITRIRQRMAELDVRSHPSDQRFALLMSSAALTKEVPGKRSVLARDTGRRLATLVASGRDARFVIDRDLGRPFAEFLAERLPSLYEDFVNSDRDVVPGPNVRPAEETD